jgi:hypothetical protein
VAHTHAFDQGGLNVRRAPPWGGKSFPGYALQRFPSPQQKPDISILPNYRTFLLCLDRVVSLFAVPSPAFVALAGERDPKPRRARPHERDRHEPPKKLAALRAESLQIDRREACALRAENLQTIDAHEMQKACTPRVRRL